VATINHFREIESWQKARELTKSVYAVSSKGPFARDFALKDQMRRAAISVLANIAEGYERGGNAEFIQFLSVAKGSVGEVEAQLYIALDQGYVTQDEFRAIEAQIRSTKRLVAGLMVYLRQSDLRGQKFK
jgi:four helix bundle protein